MIAHLVLCVSFFSFIPVNYRIKEENCNLMTLDGTVKIGICVLNGETLPDHMITKSMIF